MDSLCTDCSKSISNLPDDVMKAIHTLAHYPGFQDLHVDDAVLQHLCAGCPHNA